MLGQVLEAAQMVRAMGLSHWIDRPLALQLVSGVPTALVRQKTLVFTIILGQAPSVLLTDIRFIVHYLVVLHLRLNQAFDAGLDLAAIDLDLTRSSFAFLGLKILR